MRGKSTTKGIGEFKSDISKRLSAPGKRRTSYRAHTRITPKYPVKDTVNTFKKYGIKRKASAEANYQKII